jgi:hypothetical protein
MLFHNWLIGGWKNQPRLLNVSVLKDFSVYKSLEWSSYFISSLDRPVKVLWSEKIPESVIVKQNHHPGLLSFGKVISEGDHWS